MKYIIALDQGTTSSRTIVFDQTGTPVASENMEFEQIYPKPGWVEHRPEDILRTQTETMREAIKKSGIGPADIAAAGITNQRESVVVWDKKTGKPVYNAIVWQCRRTAPICERLEDEGYIDYIKKTTGLVLDAYFSGTKISWILGNVNGAREKAEAGDLLFGTIDTWLIWNLTGGRVHATDYSNASRTMLFDIHNLCWDQKLLDALGIPISMMPEVKNTSDDFGTIMGGYAADGTPIYAAAGDQHAALFGQACFGEGMVKNTYGTGCFMLMNTGGEAVESKNSLLTTIAWGLDGKITYALEGSVFVAGAAIQWLRDELKIISTAAETEKMAESISDTGGVYLVPAFTGLGAPWWDMYARGTIVGMTRGTKREHIVRAALESIAFQSLDVMNAMKEDSQNAIPVLKVDGGASANNFLMQFQSDITGTSVVRPKCVETTALGVAYLAGLKAGIFKSLDEIAGCWENDKEFLPGMPEKDRNDKIKMWHKALRRAENWLEEE